MYMVGFLTGICAVLVFEVIALVIGVSVFAVKFDKNKKK